MRLIKICYVIICRNVATREVDRLRNIYNYLLKSDYAILFLLHLAQSTRIFSEHSVSIIVQIASVYFTKLFTYQVPFSFALIKISEDASRGKNICNAKSAYRNQLYLTEIGFVTWCCYVNRTDESILQRKFLYICIRSLAVHETCGLPC